ncbi:MAG: polynucleotide adenylyltransferase PcnB [Kiritimatiellae bacterium]|nr:polynucleotide adenylyltransferase PcnB [Kiritimatiellia bacterium]
MKSSQTIICPRDEHRISRKNIDHNALKVLYRLSRKGFLAYLVGGSVRDLLLDRKPKDFDISTNAHPKQIRKTFGNSFLIGRRFRLVHVKFRDDVIEVSTFRRQPPVKKEDENNSTNLYQKRDNTFGTPEEDAQRRDFTINGLFYDVKTFSVIDHVGGLSDLHHQKIRSIGDPNTRFREDPVRMIRAIRFAARLNFSIERSTHKAIKRHHTEITKASAPRLLEEICKLFLFGSSEQAFRLMEKTGLLRVLIPEIDQYLSNIPKHDDLLWDLLNGLDARSTTAKRRPASLLFATLFYPSFLLHKNNMKESGKHIEHDHLARSLVEHAALRLNIPKRETLRMIRIIEIQQKLSQPITRYSQAGLISRDEFSDALLLREIYLSATNGDINTLTPWQTLLKQHSTTGKQVSNGIRKPGKRRRTRRTHYRHRQTRTRQPAKDI